MMKIIERVKPVLTCRIPFYSVVFLYLVLPNLFFLLMAQILGTTEHGYINIEFLLIGATAAFLPRTVVFLLLMADFLTDFAYGVCFTYQFSLENLLSSLRYLPLLPAARIIQGLILVAVGMLLSAALAILRPRLKDGRRSSVALLAFVVLLAPIDILGGQNPIYHKDVALIPSRVVRSPMLTLSVREVSFALVQKRSSQAKDVFMASASASLLSYLDKRTGSAEDPDIVLIVVESWGLPIDPRLERALTASYDDPRIAARYDITRGIAPFMGLTVPGEARELCQSTMGFGILDISPDQASRCLPALLHQRGYTDAAVHGYVGQMFYRSAWYPKLGFDRTWFGPDLERVGLPRCRGAFPGVCDTAIAGWLETSIRRADPEKPRFVYWVTLNSHIPVPARPDLPDDSVCATQPSLQASAAMCSWFRLVRAVHLSVSRMAAEVHGRPTVFVLVGDHAPPFGDPALRAQFSGTVVPYLILTPRQPVSPGPGSLLHRARFR